MERDPYTADLAAGQALLTFRIIGASLGIGVTLFAFVSWFRHQQQGPGNVAGDPALMFNLMLALVVTSVVAAIVLWRARVSPLIERPSPDRERRAAGGEIQTNVVIVWALIEGASLFAVVVYFLYGAALAGLLGVALIWAALAATWPRREWFDAR